MSAAELRINEDSLLKQFKQGDFDRAKAALLERYHIWQGILVANDENSVITPDDINHFRIQAGDLVNQKVKSEYEWEQLKILTVLIYLLMDASKAALPGDNAELQAQLDMLSLPHSNDFIMRRITHGADQLELEDIEKFVRYQNLVLSSYITSMSADGDTTDYTIESLKTLDGVYFDLIDTPYEVKVERREAPILPFKPEQEEAEAPAPAPVSTGLPSIVLSDQKAEFLINTMQTTSLASGALVTVASYVGKNREFNEDGIVVVPDSNQVVVIDAMGGYGNGVTAREEFVNSVLAYPGDMEASVEAAQKHYDEIELDQGGVCIIDSIIEATESSYRIVLSQAGDVHALLFDDNGELKHETVDESIGHQVINAVIGAEATEVQRMNGWGNFGRLTRATLHAKSGWRLLIYSDGIANHFDAKAIAALIENRTTKQALGSISQAVDHAMSGEKSYKDNASIAIIDLQ